MHNYFFSHGIIEKSKTTGNLLVDQCNSDFENVTKDRIKNYNTDNSLNIRRYKEEHKYLSDRQKEIEKKTEVWKFYLFKLLSLNVMEHIIALPKK